MNERIKELAEQAQKVIWPADGNVTELTDLDIEKFAELIVRECADVAYCHQNGFVVGSMIKAHFGVEE
jgi:hypothetical protein